MHYLVTGDMPSAATLAMFTLLLFALGLLAIGYCRTSAVLMIATVFIMLFIR